MLIDTVAFDADDTLWQNEKFFRLSQASFVALLEGHASGADLEARLLEAEKRNLRTYGFGIKGFVLSMIETAIEVSDTSLPVSVIDEILAIGKEMLTHPLELLPGAREVLEETSQRYRTILITKGDLFDQERKIAQSGVADLFHHVEIVTEKSPKVYSEVFGRLGSTTDKGVMIGNSLRSDIHPMLEAGGWAIYVPHPLTWEVEHAEVPSGHPRFREEQELENVPAAIETLKAMRSG